MNTLYGTKAVRNFFATRMWKKCITTNSLVCIAQKNGIINCDRYFSFFLSSGLTSSSSGISLDGMMAN